MTPLETLGKEIDIASNNSKRVTIPEKSYHQLLFHCMILNSLVNEGVDSWNGWDYAMGKLNEKCKGWTTKNLESMEGM